MSSSGPAEHGPGVDRGSPGGRRAILGLTLLALLLAAVPYIKAWSQQTEERRFTGLLGGVDDNNVYLDLIRQSEEGAWLFVNNFTPEPSRPALFNPLYLALGRVARYTGLPPIAVHHLFGAFSILLLAAAAHRFLAVGLPDSRFRVAGVALAIFASGFWGLTDVVRPLFGWRLPAVDSWLAELSTFHSLLIYPHFVFASALLILTIDGAARALTELRLRSALQAATAAVMLLFSHAFDLATALGTIALFTLALLLRDGFRHLGRRLALLSVFMVPVAAGVLLTRLMLRSEPAWAEAVQRLHFPAPEPMKLLLGTGLTGLLVLFFFAQGDAAFRRPREAVADRVLLARCWIIALPLLVYNPAISWQFHLVNGIQVPLALLALDGLRRRAFVGRAAFKRLSRTVRRIPPLRSASTVSLLLSVLCIGASLSAVNHLRWYWQGLRREIGVYLRQGDLEALEWLRDNAGRGEVVVAAPAIANFVPRLSGGRVIAGEDILSSDYAARAERVRRFYGAAGADERLSLLREFDVRWVLHGSEERRLGSTAPAAGDRLERVFESRGSLVLRVRAAN